MAVGGIGGDGSAVLQCGQKWLSSAAAQAETGWQLAVLMEMGQQCHSVGRNGSAVLQCGQKWVSSAAAQVEMG